MVDSLINITPDGNIKKKILQEGELQSETPPLESNCQIYYEGRILSTGNIFDNIYNRKERKQIFSFELGSGQVISAIDLSVASMKKGEIALITCSPEYGFGKLGCPPRIPPNASLEFEIELVSFEKKKNNIIKIESIDEKLKESEKERLEGNQSFKQGNYRKAIKSYHRALALLNGTYDEEEEKKMNNAKIFIYNNLALCYLKLNEISKAIKNAELVLKLDEKNAKAYTRLAEAFSASYEWNLAKTNYIQAIKLNPNDKSLREALEKVKKNLEEEKKEQQSNNIFFGLFSKKVS